MVYVCVCERGGLTQSPHPNRTLIVSVIFAVLTIEYNKYTISAHHFHYFNQWSIYTEHIVYTTLVISNILTLNLSLPTNKVHIPEFEPQ